MQGCWQDLRQAFRMLARQRGLTLAAWLSLALGVGANSALFTITYGVLLRPLPYAQPERLVRISEEHPGAVSALGGTHLSSLSLTAMDPLPESFTGLGAYALGSAAHTKDGVAERLTLCRVSPAIFSLLGREPVMGRGFVAEDALPGAAKVAVLSHGFWRERFGADPGVLGHKLELDGETVEVVGVGPEGFFFPQRGVLLWTPLEVPPPTNEKGEPQIRLFSVIARLAPGVTAAQAEDEGTALLRAIERPMVMDLLFGKGAAVEMHARPLLAEETGEVRPALLLFGAGGLLLLAIGCANVANLLLSRGVARQRELAVKASLGASRWRLARQLLTESLVLAASGGLLGLLLAWGLVHLFPAVAPSGFPRLAEVRLDAVSFAFALVVAVLAGLLSGVVPALRAGSTAVEPALREGAHGSAGGRSVRAGLALLVAEGAVAVLLLVGAGLLGRGFSTLLAVDGGFDPERVVVASVDLGRGTTPARTEEFVERTLAELGELPGVEGVAASNMAPLLPGMMMTVSELPGAGPNGETVEARSTTYVVTPDYAEVLGLRLQQGRFLTEADLGSGTRAMVVNEEFVRSYLGGPTPVVGRQWPELWQSAPGQVTEIVGVVASVRRQGLDTAPEPEIYLLPYGSFKLTRQMALLVRTQADPEQTAATVRALLRRREPGATFDVQSLPERLSTSVAQPRFASLTIAAFAVLALALAAIGLYGVLSYNVAQRRRELGIRAALGAGRSTLVRLVLRKGLAVTAAGLALGLVAAALASRLLQSFLYGLSPLDPATFIAAPLFLLAVSTLACLVPARKAATVDPTEVLRGE